MAGETLSGKGIATRFVVAILLVYATWNPMGWSFYDWAVRPLFGGTPTAGPAALKFLAAVVLIAGWVVYLQATKRSLGLGGVTLVVALCAGLVWLLYSLGALDHASGTLIGHLVLITMAIVLALGVSWSHISKRLTGQQDTDTVG